MACVLRLPDLMVYEPTLQHEIQDKYQDMQERLSATHEKMLDAGLAVQSDGLTLSSSASNVTESLQIGSARLHALYLRLYSIQISLQAIMNGILQAYEVNNAALKEDETNIVDSVINLVVTGSAWKPFGAAWIPVCLTSVWASSTDETQKSRIQEVWRTIWQAHAGHTVEQAAEMLAATLDRLRLEAAKAREAKLYIDT